MRGAQPDIVREFDTLVYGWGLDFFAPKELRFLGGAHFSRRSAGFGLNTLPPKRLWTNMLVTARVADKARGRLESVAP